MTPPRPWLVPALALWGWQCDWLLLALGMAALLEAPRLLRPRLDIRSEDFTRLWNATAVLFVAVVFYLILGRQGVDGIQAFIADPTNDGARRASTTALTFVRWLPFVLFPFVLAHAWSRTPTLPWRTFSMYAQAQARRRSQIELPPWIDQPVQPGLILLVATLFASTAAADHRDAYPPLLALAVLLALWPGRNRRYGVVTWSLLILALLGAAWAARHGHRAVRTAWQAVEERLLNRAGGGGGDSTGQVRRTTALGMIGELTWSARIILRLERDDDGPAPGLLREAVFTRFSGTVWSTADTAFNALDGSHLAADPLPHALHIARFTSQGESPLPLPDEGARLHLSSPGSVMVNRLGAVRLLDAGGLARYEVSPPAAPDDPESPGLDAPPSPADRELATLAPQERDTFTALARELELATLPPGAAIARVERWFREQGFRYTRWQDQPPPGSTPLRRFLGTTRAGHCEYYATATALLLRAGGLPTRYAIGYAPTPAGARAWTARGRDVHAWCLAYDGHRWISVDTTPAVWHATEADAAAWYEPLSDTLDSGWFALARLREGLADWTGGLFLGGLLVLAWIAWRQVRGSRWRRIRPARDAAPARDALDRELHAWLATLAARHPDHPPRQPGETPARWLARLPLPPSPERDEAIALHRRLRYAPDGLNGTGRARLAVLLVELASRADGV